MKQLSLIFIFYFLVFNNCIAQWQPDVRLTNNPASSYINLNCLASDGNILHLAWEDKRNANFEIYYKRSTDGGLNWEADTRLTNNYAISGSPSISVTGSNVHVVWFDTRDGSEEIYYKRSTNGGTNWGQDVRLTNSPSLSSVCPRLSSSGSTLHLVWQKFINSKWRILYKCSTDEGLNWSSDVILSSDTVTSNIPSISTYGQFVHVAWVEEDTRRIIYKCSTDGGLNWKENKQISGNIFNADMPSISANNLFVFIVWSNGNQNIYYNKSTDGGLSWTNETQLTYNSNGDFRPSVAISGSLVHVTWEDYRNGNNNSEIYYRRSSDGGVNWGGDERLTNASSYSYNSYITVSGNTINVVWIDDRDGNDEIYYKRNPKGNTIGIIKISTNIPTAFTLHQNYPNPFNPTTMIKFDIPSSSLSSPNVTTGNPIKLKVYDILGEEIATLVNEKLSPGNYEIKFDGINLPSGIYFVRLSDGNNFLVRKINLIK